ncbi:MAG: glycosyltransferase family 4 protein [Cyanobacteria bacterium]|nr:glycosyltransferase family 4 protein [Cyanobacteriota bacterium]
MARGIANSTGELKRLAIVAGHPVQYISPWLNGLADKAGIEVKVFYLWDLGVSSAKDPGFGRQLQWDIPLLDGYAYQFIPNRASKPGNSHFFGYINPGLPSNLAAWRPDAILLMNYAFLTYVLLLLDPRFWKVPFIFRGDSHNLNRTPSLKDRISRLFRNLLFRRFDACLVVGKANYHYYRDAGVPASKLFTGLHAVDNARFIDAKKSAALEAGELRKNLGINREIVIIFVGKFIEVKRPLDLLIACAQLPAHLLRTAKIVFVGDGPLKETIRRQAERLGLDGVLFLPFQNQSMLPAVYSMGDVLVLPSLSETWGLVVNEAMNLGCPAIVTERVGCAYELVVPAQTGWVFPPGNTGALTQCIEEALSDPERLYQIGENARRHVLQFSYDGITASLQQALQHACHA